MERSLRVSVDRDAHSRERAISESKDLTQFRGLNRAALIVVSFNPQPNLRDHGYGAIHPCGMPVYSATVAGID